MESVTATRVMLELQSGQENITLAPNLTYEYFKIEQFSAPHVWNYLPAGTTNFTDSLGVVHVLPYPPQQPNAGDLVNLINAMNTSDTGGATYTLNISSSNMTITFNGSANFGLNFDEWTGQHLGVTSSVGGGRYGFAGVNTFTTGHFFFGTQQILITTGLLSVGLGMSYSNITGPLSSAATSTVQTPHIINLPVKSAIGEVETWYLGDYSPKYKIGQNPMTLQIKITDEFGRVIDVAPQRMYLTLIYYCVG